MSRTLLFLTLGAIPSAAAAQSSNTNDPKPWITSDWTGEVAFTLSPLFGKDAPFDLQRDTVDESSAEFYVRATKKLGGPINFRLQAGLTANPNFLDVDAVGSAYYVQASLGEADDSLTRYVAVTAKGETVPSKFQDTVLPYARYRFVRSFESDAFFRREKAKDHQIVFGLRFRDVRGIMCGTDEARRLEQNPDETRLICSKARGLYLEIDPRLTIVESNLPARERLTPSLRGEIISRPLWAGIRFFGQAYGEISYFSSARAPDGQLREDRLRRFTVGIQFSDPATRLLQRAGGFLKTAKVEATVGPRYERKVSNNPDSRYERWFIAPSLTVSREF